MSRLAGRHFIPNLHTHDHYSLKDGCSTSETYAEIVKELGGTSLAITNHGQAGGFARQYFACKKAGIKPVFGLEGYVNEKRLQLPRVKEALDVARKRVKKKVIGAKEKVLELETYVREVLRPSRHAVLLARTRKGYQNLCRVSTDSWMRGFYYSPRTDTAFLAEHAEGLIYSTACIGGAIPHLARPDFDAGVAEARRLQGIFGPENFVVELMATAYAKQRETNQVMLRLAHEVGAPTIVTCDVHYAKPEDQKAQSALLLMRDDKTIKDVGAGEGAWQFESKDLYWKTLEDVRATWEAHHKDYWPKEDFERAIRNTYALADSVEAWDFDTSLKLPGVFENPAGLLRELVRKGFDERKARGQIPAPGKSLKDYAERLLRELSVIEGKGFSEYLLILWDLCKHARDVGARVGPGRGSACASLVVYLLRITEIDPLRFNLIFERFLDPGRKDAPDVDLDFSPQHREEIKKYLEGKYPAVATIGTYSTFKARSTIQAVGRVYGLDHREVMAVTKPLGDVSAIDLDKKSLAEVCELWPEVKKLALANPEAWQVIETLDGLVSHRGQHASGVLVGPASAFDELPFIKDPRTGNVCTAFADTAVQGDGLEYEGREVSKLGWIKVDILGQNTLNYAAGAVEILERTTGEVLDLSMLPLDDPEALAIASSGDVPGVFQFDTPTSRPLLRLVGVDAFEDLAAITSLARPGPLRNGLPAKFAKYKRSGDAWKAEFPKEIHEDLAASRGLMIYQEDIMLTAMRIGGFEMSEANQIRKVLAKKLSPELLAQWKTKFVDGGTARGHDPEKLGTVFDTLHAYCAYVFAKPHAMAYAREAYDQLYVLAHYPLPYFASLLQSAEKWDKLAPFSRAAMCRGIRVLPPSVQSSKSLADVEGDAIRFGLAAIKGVANGADAVVSVRPPGGFSSFEDFLERRDRRKANAKVVDLLVHAGACDDLPFDRTGLEAILEDEVRDPIVKRNALVARRALIEKKDRPTVHVPSVLLAMERDLVGIALSYWSGPDPAKIRAARKLGTIAAEVEKDHPRLRLLAEVARAHEHRTSKGTMAFLELADETGSLENVVLWASQWKDHRVKLGVGKVVAIRLERRAAREDRYGKWSYHVDESTSGEPVVALSTLRRASVQSSGATG